MNGSGSVRGFYDSAPMALDRSAGWRYFSARGDVYEVDGLWYLTSYEAVRFAQQHPEIFSSAEAYVSLGSPVPLIPLTIDPPNHTRYRRVLDPMLAPRVISQLEDDLRQQVGALIDSFVGRGWCDVVGDIARLYPTQVIMTLFGLPLEDRDRFIEWVETLVETSGSKVGQPTPAQAKAGLQLFLYLQDYVARKRANPSNDMLSRVLGLTGEDAWTDEEVLGLCFLFTIAGLDTVTAAIGFVMLHLARDRDLRHRVIAAPDLVGPLIEEVLRLELPAPTTARVTKSEVEVCGVTIPARARVLLVLATANRDPKHWANADEIDLAQADRGHLSFGGGIHRCLGSHLARRELRLVVEEFHRRIPDYGIAEDVQPRIVWPSGTLHLERLPLVFTPGGSR